MADSVDPFAVAVLGYHDGSAGQVETWFTSATGYRIACFVHEAAEQPLVDIAEEQKKRISKLTTFPENGMFKSRPLIAALNWPSELLKRGIGKVLPLTADNALRLAQIAACEKSGLELVSAIHPSTLILPEARISPGVWINAGCIIGYKAELRAGVIINTGVHIDHHNVLEECCQVDPGVVTAGSVTLRSGAHVHTGAILANRVEVGAFAEIGAGSLVLKNVPPNTVAWGVPARAIRLRS